MKKQPHVAVRTTLLSAGYNLAALSARPALRRLRAAKGFCQPTGARRRICKQRRIIRRSVRDLSERGMRYAARV